MAGGEERRRTGRQGGGCLRLQEKRVASLFHDLLSLPREPRMKIQSLSQEMKGHPGVSAQHREILEAAESGLSKGCQRREDVIGQEGD